MELLLLLWGGNKRDLHLTRCKMDLGETIFCLNESNSLWTEVGKYGIMGRRERGKISMGKRIIGIILVCACLIGLIGCASEPKNRPYDKESKTGGATLADFGLYKDGKLTEHLDLKGESAGGSFIVEYRGPLEAENLAYRTWRGVRCSDNIQKLLEAYADWGMPDEVSFGGISEPIENLDQIKELGSQNWSGELGSCYIEYIWYCKPGTCEFTREPASEEDVEYRISFSFDNQLGADLNLTRVFYNRFGSHPEINIKAKQEADDEQQPSKYQGEILENMSEKGVE